MYLCILQFIFMLKYTYICSHGWVYFSTTISTTKQVLLVLLVLYGWRGNCKYTLNGAVVMRRTKGLLKREGELRGEIYTWFVNI